MFEKIELAPADPILGLNEAFRADPREDKINLGVGVYKDEAGQTPILTCVKHAEARVLETETTKGYLGIDGHPAYREQVLGLLFGAEHDVIQAQRARAAQAPGGTGALRIAADFIASNLSGKRVWISNPSWANHRGIFESAGLEVREYRYYDAANKTLDFDGLMADLDAMGSDDVVILHGCCHNPTGVDPSLAQWQQMASSAKAKGWLPLFDFAYQGFAKDVESDAAGLRHFAGELNELMVASSFSKNFGLYNERIGALTLVAADADAAERGMSQIKRVIRTNYSNPPSHGAQVVATILADAELKALWLEELAQMCQRIHRMRTAFVKGLADAGVEGDFGFIEQQNGMFSFSGLNKDQVEQLKQEFGIYIVGSGRINVAGMTESNLPALIKAIAAVS
ncbi:aromatic amino acid transaminase [Ferrimonas balearica]|uniref:amino acid aminotransferase n=1 Tax=Ferrimonas balearica TaxID=44012 RepID=UPI001C9408FB|nr:amino acid aminotransferase [Ferrimonas balearica]MBY5981074.1 aspartate/tyrosine/aromatic aminotransferase [Ferrimonas balearica]